MMLGAILYDILNEAVSMQCVTPVRVLHTSIITASLFGALIVPQMSGFQPAIEEK